MRKLISTLLITAAPIAMAGSVHADDDSSHWYAGFDLGISTMPEANFSHANNQTQLESDKDRSFVGGLYVGHKFEKFRLELEYLVRKNEFGDFVDLPVIRTSGIDYATANSMRNSTLMINGWLPVVGGEKWSLLAGAGVGWANIDLSGVNVSGDFAGTTGGTAPAIQAMAQFVRPAGPVEFGIGYRMVRSAKETFETNFGDFTTRAKHNELFARISWRFGADSKPAKRPEPRPVMPEPRPEPKPEPVAAPTPKPTKPVTQPVEQEPAPLPKPFIVYFDFDKSDITSTAARTISEAANAFREFKAVEIHTIGHADKAGSDVYNERLSQRRAEAVRDMLVREGVPESKILLTSKGENDPAVRTADGVREEENRRVEIKLIR